MSVEQVLVYTRLAADKVGPTKMDRCEDVQPSPHTGKVYVACTNNSDRGKVGKEGATEVNPRNENRDGHVVEITETGDQTSTGVHLEPADGLRRSRAGRRTYFSGYPADKVSPISCPDNLAFDSVGNLWISTDGAALHHRLQRRPVQGHPRRRRARQASSSSWPSRATAETCGPIIHDEERTVFVAVQHPGEDGTFDAPARPIFPDYVGRDDAGARPGRAPRARRWSRCSARTPSSFLTLHFSGLVG